MAVRSTSTDPVMFAVISRSIKKVGRGMTSTTTTATTERGTAMWVSWVHRSDRVVGGLAIGQTGTYERHGTLHGRFPLFAAVPGHPVAFLAHIHYVPAAAGIEGWRGRNSRHPQLAIVWTSRKARAVGESE